MPGSNEYDAGLLQSAPKLDKKTIQEGYSTAILDPPEKSTSQSRTNSTGLGDTGSQTHLATSHTTPSALESQPIHDPHPHPLKPTCKPTPFWKTRKGVLVIGAVVVVAVVIAAVVGGVVGSRRKKLPGDMENGEGQMPGVSGQGDSANGVGGGASSSAGGLPSGLAGSVPTVTGSAGTGAGLGTGAATGGGGGQETGAGTGGAPAPTDGAAPPPGSATEPESQVNAFALAEVD